METYDGKIIKSGEPEKFSLILGFMLDTKQVVTVRPLRRNNLDKLTKEKLVNYVLEYEEKTAVLAGKVRKLLGNPPNYAALESKVIGLLEKEKNNYLIRLMELEKTTKAQKKTISAMKGVITKLKNKSKK